ncbi:MAG: hypothetical protein ACJ746_08680 [Bryobacteraceae bacterium]
MIQARVPSDKRFAVTEEGTVHFACNAVNVGNTIILNYATPQLASRLASQGFEVIQTHMSEFMKAGGSTKCLSLRLNEF